MVYGWCWKATNLHLAHEQRWVAYLNGSHFSNTWEFWDWDRLGIMEWIRGWDDRGKTLWQDTPKKEMLRFSRFQQKLFMIPTLKTETENFHGKSHPEVIKVHRGHQSPPLRENWWQQIW